MTSRVVYRNLGQVLETLKRYNHLPAVSWLLNIDRNLVGSGRNGEIHPKFSGQSPHPLLVVEGLDGCGKTTMTKCLSETLGMRLMSTPPKEPRIMAETRKFFDSQPEELRRAYYSLGNYLAGRQVVDCNLPVVMDRFWHSTAAFAMAHKIRAAGVDNGNSAENDKLLNEWPIDLLKPDLVLFFQVSERERIKRHANRDDFTSTPEEKILAEDKDFRKNLVNAIRGIKGVPFLEVNVDGEKADVQKRVLKLVTEAIPSLLNLSRCKYTLP